MANGPLTIGPGGRLLCHVPKLPLMPGLYTYTIWCTVGGTLEDWVADAGELSVIVQYGTDVDADISAFAGHHDDVLVSVGCLIRGERSNNRSAGIIVCFKASP